jgi:hypothetical protein
VSTFAIKLDRKRDLGLVLADIDGYLDEILGPMANTAELYRTISPKWCSPSSSSSIEPPVLGVHTPIQRR